MSIARTFGFSGQEFKVLDDIHPKGVVIRHESGLETHSNWHDTQLENYIFALFGLRRILDADNKEY